MKQNLIYTGVGSRATPREILKMMEDFAALVGQHGWLLRSGAAVGADSAFERGCDSVNGRKEIFLPWRKSEGHSSPLFLKDGDEIPILSKMIQEGVMDKAHVQRLTQGARKLHARNYYQVCYGGRTSDLLVCWTEEGKLKGGTATAIKLAHAKGVRVYNLGDLEGYTRVKEFMEANS